MNFDTAESLTLIGLLFSMAIAGWGIIRFFLLQLNNMLNYIDKKEEKIREEINQLNNSCVKRDDLNNHIERIDSGINQLNGRFDQLLTVLANQLKSGK